MANKTGNGKTILGVAATNRPNVRLRKHPIEFYDKDGVEYARVPFMVQGKYRYGRTGETLKFFDDEYEEFLKNWENEVYDGQVGLDIRHRPELGMLVWFEKSKNGWIQQEEVGGDKLLVGHGPVVSKAAKDALLGYAAASIEYHPNYTSNRLMSASYGQEVVLEVNENGNSMFENPTEEDAMTDTITLEEHNVKLNEAESTIAGLESKVDELENKVKALEAQLPEPEPEIPAALQARLEALEADNLALKKAKREANVRALMADIKLPKDGKILPAVTLETIEKVLLEAPLGEDGEIKLEDNYSLEDVRSYYTRAFLSLAQNLDRTIGFEGKTAGEDERMDKEHGGEESTALSDDELDEAAKALWEVK